MQGRLARVMTLWRTSMEDGEYGDQTVVVARDEQ